MREHMHEVHASATPSLSLPCAMGEEERYVKVASRFFRVNLGGDGDGAMTRRPHYLDSCFLCKGSIYRNRDIFMYKGDAAFCSEECRQEQMDMDEALHVVERHQYCLLPQHKPASNARRQMAAVSRPPLMHRRPTMADLAAHTPVAAS